MTFCCTDKLKSLPTVHKDKKYFFPLYSASYNEIHISMKADMRDNCITITGYLDFFLIVAPCILIYVQFTHQQMHFY